MGELKLGVRFARQLLLGNRLPRMRSVLRLAFRGGSELVLWGWRSCGLKPW